MAEVFSATQPSGNGETPRVSLIQGVINEIDASTVHKQRAIDLLDDLKGWLIRSLERDIGFHDRLVQAIADNSPQIDGTLMDDDIAKIASTFAHRADDNAATNNS